MYAAYEILWTIKSNKLSTTGRSYHKTLVDANAYIDNKAEGVKDEVTKRVPLDYFSPTMPKLIEVTKKFYERLKKEKTIWIF